MWCWPARLPLRQTTINFIPARLSFVIFLIIGTILSFKNSHIHMCDTESEILLAFLKKKNFCRICHKWMQNRTPLKLLLAGLLHPQCKGNTVKSKAVVSTKERATAPAMWSAPSSFSSQGYAAKISNKTQRKIPLSSIIYRILQIMMGLCRKIEEVNLCKFKCLCSPVLPGLSRKSQAWEEKPQRGKLGVLLWLFTSWCCL